jgi:Holliday junction resolvasome RuvABC endonuclease subunit
MPVAVPTWKKEAMGKGNARKPEIMAWARANGYRGALQDAADAWGIATAALVLAGGRDA